MIAVTSRTPDLIKNLHTQTVVHSSWMQFADEASALFCADDYQFDCGQAEQHQAPAFCGVGKYGGDIQTFLQQFSDNMAVVDGNGVVVAKNAAFDRLKSNKILLYIYGAKINFYQKLAQQWFNQGLQQTFKPDQCLTYKMIVSNTDYEQTIILKLTAFEYQCQSLLMEKQPYYLLSIDNFDLNVRYEQYKQLFGLTKAEAQLAAYLSLGKTINQLAGKKMLSKHTLRTQLKNVFVKTDTHSQNELIVLLKNVV
jgi:DNA-binding CsgD family transcriptional regulator